MADPSLINLQVQKGRDDVMLEFPHDDTGGDQEDALFEMSFFVPKENDRYAVTEGEATQEVSLQCEVPVQKCTL